jgi:hypothetical protein
MKRPAIALYAVLTLMPASARADNESAERRALAGDQASIQALRAEGPAGLGKLLLGIDASGKPGPAHAAAIDAVAAQKDAYASGLYWYTDLSAAQTAARREDKPILSLRMLGRLDQELSCANSRFFRTTLYPDPAVSKLLRDRFILHWSSERPVPVVTIDFGDGRVLKRTITGNSIHYVLDADARPIDGLPGLYSAEMFVRKLNGALELAGELSKLDARTRDARLREWHAQATAKTEPPAPVKLSPAAAKMVLAKAPPAALAGRQAISKSAVEMPIVNQLRSLEESIAQDTAHNENELHHRLHLWFAHGEIRQFDALNTRVYSELFLTPRSDPWLGLAPPDAFAALENGGLAQRSP